MHGVKFSQILTSNLVNTLLVVTLFAAIICKKHQQLRITHGNQGRTCKEFIGVVGHSDRLFTKMISQRHHATEAQISLSLLLMLHISTVIVYPIIFLSSLFSTIFPIKEVAILG